MSAVGGACRVSWHGLSSSGAFPSVRSASPAAWTAVQAQRYMHRYGVTNEDFGHVSVQLRKYASTNPNGLVLSRGRSRWRITRPRAGSFEPIFRLLDCTSGERRRVWRVVVTSLGASGRAI